MPLSKKKKLKQIFYPVLLAGITFLTTLIATYFLSVSIERHERERFENLLFQIEQQITFRMQTYTNTLVQAKSMFEINNLITRDEYHRYIDSLNILKDYPGIQGIGFAKKISASELAKHEKEIQREGFPEYKVWPTNKRDVYYSVVYLEPVDWRNKPAFGFDMHTDSVRSKAMDMAMRSASPAASDKIKLVQEVGQAVQPGFNIYTPIYKHGVDLSSIESREKNLIGFIYAAFRSYDLFNEVFAHIGRKLPLKVDIYANDDLKDEVIYQLNPYAVPSKGPYHYEKSIILPIAQRAWKIKISTLPVLPQASLYIPHIIFILGTLVSFLVFWIILRQIQFSTKENARAAQLEILNNVGRKLAAELELPKLIQFVTDAGRVITDATWGAYFTRIKADQGPHYELSAVSGGSQGEFGEIISIIDGNFINQLLERKKSHVENFSQQNVPLRSFLSVSVISRSGDIIGGLLYGDRRSDNFGERDKKIVEGIAAQAAIAIDNAHLFKSANEAIKVRDEFLNVASHELKTPITSLKLQFQQAARLINTNNPKVYDREAVNRRVKKTVLQLDRMNGLIEDMLDASRVSVSRMTLNKTCFDLNDLTSEIIDSFAEQLTVQKIPYLYEKSKTPAWVYADSFRLEQVISNLISNAIKYGKGSTVEIKISDENKAIHLSVRDKGMGIAKDQLDKVFERYERAVTGSNISGLGLGLYISKHIAVAHEGEITVESKLGEGTTFTLIIPKACDE